LQQWPKKTVYMSQRAIPNRLWPRAFLRSTPSLANAITARDFKLTRGAAAYVTRKS
jgi:hypothetical protein